MNETRISWHWAFGVGLIIGGVLAASFIYWRLNSGPGRIAKVEIGNVAGSPDFGRLSTEQWILANEALEHANHGYDALFVMPLLAESSSVHRLITIRYQHGPFTFMPAHPYTNCPISDLLYTIALTGRTNEWDQVGSERWNEVLKHLEKDPK